MGRLAAPGAPAPDITGPDGRACARPPFRLRAAACAALVALACGACVAAPSPALAAASPAAAASGDNLLDIVADSGSRVLAWFGIGSSEAVAAASDESLLDILGEGAARVRDLFAPSTSTGAAGADGRAASLPAREPTSADAASASGGSDVPAGDEAAGVPADGTLREAKVQAVFDTLLAAARQGRTDTIDLSGISPTQAEYDEAFSRLELDPWWAHTAGTTRTSRGDVVVDAYVRYRLDDAMLPTYEADVNAALDALVAQVDPDAGAYDKALEVYDWLQQNVTYDHETADGDVTNSVSRTPLGALAYGSAVCSGYASAFCLALERLGIPCELTDDYGTHIWNVVCLDGGWYYCDATWDDADDGSEPAHFYFMVSQATMARDHDAWPVAHEAPADLDRPGVIRYSPDECSITDALIELALSGYEGSADVLDYGISGDDAMAITNDINYSGAVSDLGSFTWNWSSTEDGRVRRFWITY